MWKEADPNMRFDGEKWVEADGYGGLEKYNGLLWGAAIA